MHRLAQSAAILAIIGAINWGLIGLFNWNLVDAIFGGGSREATSGLSRLIYTLVGIAGVVLAALMPRLFTPERRVPPTSARTDATRRDRYREPPRPQP